MRKEFCDCHNDRPRIVRVMPLESSGNIILCRDGYIREIAFRRERNVHLEPANKFDLPAWEDLKPYPED